METLGNLLQQSGGDRYWRILVGHRIEKAVKDRYQLRTNVIVRADSIILSCPSSNTAFKLNGFKKEIEQQLVQPLLGNQTYRLIIRTDRSKKGSQLSE